MEASTYQHNPGLTDQAAITRLEGELAEAWREVSRLQDELSTARLENDLLSRLWRSSESLHRRFNVWRPTRDDALKVVMEEVGEFIIAAYSGDMPTIREAAGEAADVFVTVMGVLMAIRAKCLNKRVELRGEDWKAHEPEPSLTPDELVQLRVIEGRTRGY